MNAQPIEPSPSRQLSRAQQTLISLLRPALKVIRTKGNNATTLDDICSTAGVIRGGFFHHIAGKEDLAIAATRYGSKMRGALFASAPHQQITDPRERILAYMAKAKGDANTAVHFTAHLRKNVQQLLSDSAASSYQHSNPH